MIRRLLRQEEIYLRIPEDGLDFIYTVKRGKEVLKSVLIPPKGRSRPLSERDGEYYGDSRAMD